MKNNRQDLNEKSGLSVVIPTYKREQVLIDTITLLLQHRTDNVEILVVDQTQEHTPQVEEKLAQWVRRQDVRLIKLDTPSIPLAMNVGLVKARNSKVLFLDDDVEFSADFLNAHIRASDDHHRVFIVGRVIQPWQTGSEHVPKDNAGCDPDNFDYSSLVPAKTSRAIACNFQVDRDLALSIGGFDENFGGAAYRFESEFADRAHFAGIHVQFCPDAAIKYLHYAEGGTRGHGHHLRTIKPAHSVGKYYYLINAYRVERRMSRLLVGPFRAVATKHHLRNPWWIPVSFAAEIFGVIGAFLKTLKGRLLLDEEKVEHYLQLPEGTVEMSRLDETQKLVRV